MFQLMKIERTLHKCPEIDFDEEQWPLISDDKFRVIEEKCRGRYRDEVYIFPFFREKEDGTKFIDLYFWCRKNKYQTYQRFIICEGYRLTSNKERRFIEFTRNRHLEFDLFEKFCGKVTEEFPSWHFCYYSYLRIGEALEHIYYASHRSGAKEVLYKADLGEIAWNLHQIPSANLAGTKPQTIIAHDLSLKLLHVLNSSDSVSVLFDEERTIYSKKVFSRFSGLMGERLPNVAQWEYLCAIYNDDGEYGYRFNRSIYDSLSRVGYVLDIEEYMEFYQLKNELKDIMDFPVHNKKHMKYDIEIMRSIKLFRDSKYRFLCHYEERQQRYEYEGEKYTIIMPKDAIDIEKEAYRQSNCLDRYVHRVLKGETDVLFLRRKDDISRSYVTMEIRNNMIVQVKGRFNVVPSDEVLDFLEEYSEAKGIKYDRQGLSINHFYNEFPEGLF